MFRSKNSLVLLLLGLTLPLYAEEPLPEQTQNRLNQVQSALDAFEQVDTLQIVMSNSSNWEATINLRDDSTQPWQATKLASGQTIVLNRAQMVSLVTPKSDGGVYNQTYQLEGGQKYVVYWNREFWDVIKVANK